MGANGGPFANCSCLNLAEFERNERVVKLGKFSARSLDFFVFS